MFKPRLALLFAFGLIASAAGSQSHRLAQAPRITKPRPAPPTPPNVAPLPPAVYDPTLQVGGEDVKARKIETRLSVDVHVNGRGPYKFIVDSGADTSVVGLRIARDLELPLATPVILNAMTSRNIVDRVRVDRLTVGSSTIGDLELPALREGDLGGEGMIGIDALVRQRLLMDFEKNVIKVEDARVPQRREPGEIVITARRQHGQLILTHVKALGYELDAVIDTGSQITIGNLALRDKLIRQNRARFAVVPVIGVTGETANLQMARINRLELGPVTLRDVPMAFADVPPFKTFGLHEQPALLLGTDILENFRSISLDFRARKVRFLLRRCEDAVVISTDPSNFSRFSARGNQELCRR